MVRRGGVAFVLVAAIATSIAAFGGEREPSALARFEVTPALTRSRRTLPPHQPTVSKRRQSVAEASASTPDAFRSPEDCLALLRQGARVKRNAGTARVGAWNVRWFPDGIAGDITDQGLATDVDWLACTLAYMNVDAVALAEIKSKPRSKPAIEQLVARLDVLTNGKHTVRIDDCPDENGQHVAWLVNEQRVSVADWQMHAPINPHGEACAGQLRPGLGVQLRFPGGLDLHGIAVHLKSGGEPRDLELRRTSFEGLERVIGAVTRRTGDADVLVAGDLNTMGCASCSVVTHGVVETSWLDNRLRAFRPQVRRVPSDIGCSLYYQRQPSLLDHFLVTSAMSEAPVANTASVYGHCRELKCESNAGSEPTVSLRLSDHCPIVLTLLDQDLD